MYEQRQEILVNIQCAGFKIKVEYKGNEGKTISRLTPESVWNGENGRYVLNASYHREIINVINA